MIGQCCNLELAPAQAHYPGFSQERMREAARDDRSLATVGSWGILAFLFHRGEFDGSNKRDDELHAASRDIQRRRRIRDWRSSPRQHIHAFDAGQARP